MSGRPNRHSRRPSTGMPSLFSSQELPDLAKSIQQLPCPTTSNVNSAPPLPVSLPAAPLQMTNKVPVPPNSLSDS